MERFEGIARLYGPAADRLARAHVMIVGLGGVGAWAAEALARSGIGALTLVDGDDVCISNVNRQIQAMDGTIGRPKADVMAERMRAIHPACRVTAVRKFFTRSEADPFFAEAYDFVVDCVDGVTAKASLIGHCRRRGIAVITCGAAGGKVDPSRVTVADLAAAHHDRLLMYVRKLLRKHHGFPARGNKKFGVPCVFSPEPTIMPEHCASEVGRVALNAADEETRLGASGSTTTAIDPTEADLPLTCEGRLGSAVFVTAVFGFHAAAHVVNALTRPSAAK